MFEDAQREGGKAGCVQIEQPTIDALVEEQSRLFPNRIAIKCGERVLSYGELNRRANLLAHHLILRGLKPGGIVSVLCGKNISVVIAKLAVMKCGAAYASLDQGWPLEKIQEYLLVISTSIILRDRDDHLYETALGWINVFVPDEYPDGTISSPRVMKDIGNPIYLAPTSGSTGQPRPVVYPQEGLLNRFKDMNARYSNEKEQVVLATGSMSHVPIEWQLFWPLVNGARVVLPVIDIFKYPRELLACVAKEGVTLVDMIASYFDVFSRFAFEAPGKLKSVQYILIGGEAINASLVSRFKKRFPTIRVFNTYGSTETQGVLNYEVLMGDEKGEIPIGFPIDGVSLKVLDKSFREVEKGAVGGLFLGGLCLASGYFKDTTSTKRNFVELPGPSGATERFYNSHDLVYERDDGAIVYCGRSGDEVNVLGQRVNTFVVNTHVLNHEMVEQACTLFLPSANNRGSLISFVVPNEAVLWDENKLRADLRSALHGVMMPGRFKREENLLFNSNGKVDKRALLKSLNVAKASLPMDQGLLGDVLQETFLELGLEAGFSDVDDFFKIGGDSIKFIYLIKRLEDYLNLTIDPSVLKGELSIKSLVENISILQVEDSSDFTGSEYRGVKGLLDESAAEKKIGTLACNFKGGVIVKGALLCREIQCSEKSGAVFWCANNYNLGEFVCGLDVDVSVYAFPGAQNAIGSRHDDVSEVVDLFVGDIVKINPTSPIVLGGNCFGALLMFRVSQKLLRLGYIVDDLIMVEQVIPDFYSQDVYFIFGKKSHFNPFVKFENPQLSWKRYLGNGFDHELVDVIHGQFFSKVGVKVFSQVVGDRLRRTIDKYRDKTDLVHIRGNGPAPVMPRCKFPLAFELAYEVPNKLWHRNAFTLTTTLLNRGVDVIDVSNYGALFLMSRWFFDDGRLVEGLSSNVAVDENINECAAFGLNVSTPVSPGQYYLEIDLVEEGVQRFSDERPRFNFHLMTVL